MDPGLLAQLRVAASATAAEQAVEHPSNAPLEERYALPFPLASRRKRWRHERFAETPGPKEVLRDPLAARLELGQTRDAIGTGTWTGGVVLARLLEALCEEAIPCWTMAGRANEEKANAPFITDETRAWPVVELGSGTGIAGLAAALLADFRSVTLTDLPGLVLDNLERNVERNIAKFADRGEYHCEEVRAMALDWHNVASFPPCGLLLGAELVYEQGSVDPLISVLESFLLAPAKPLFLFANSTCGRPGYRVFKQRMLDDSRFRVVQMGAKAIQRLAAPAFTEGIDVLVVQAHG